MQDVFEVQNHSWNLHEYGERRGCLRRRGENEASYASLLREDTEQTQQMLIEAGLPAPQCYTCLLYTSMARRNGWYTHCAA